MKLHFLVEGPSEQQLLEALLPRLIPNHLFQVYAHRNLPNWGAGTGICFWLCCRRKGCRTITLPELVSRLGHCRWIGIPIDRCWHP